MQQALIEKLLPPALCSLYTIIFQKLAKIEVNLKFRVLVLVPVDHLSKHSSISKCHKLVFQTSTVRQVLIIQPLPVIYFSPYRN